MLQEETKGRIENEVETEEVNEESPESSTTSTPNESPSKKSKKKKKKNKNKANSTSQTEADKTAADAKVLIQFNQKFTKKKSWMENETNSMKKLCPER